VEEDKDDGAGRGHQRWRMRWWEGAERRRRGPKPGVACCASVGGAEEIDGGVQCGQSRRCNLRCPSPHGDRMAHKRQAC